MMRWIRTDWSSIKNSFSLMHRDEAFEWRVWEGGGGMRQEESRVPEEWLQEEREGE